MPDFQTLKQQATEYRKVRNYTEALPLYKQLWEEYRESCGVWEGWAYAFCLKQQKDYKKSLEICREVYTLKPDFKNIKDVYAWSIYHTEIGVQTINNETQFFRAGTGILRLSTQEDKSVKKEPNYPCIYTMAVFKILEYLNDKAIYPTDKILEWTNKLNFEFLENSPYSFTDNEGKTRELASKKEQYFMWRTKALLEKQLYQECIDLCENALNIFENFHYSNDVWFARRISLSYKGLGQPETALEQLKNLLKRKNEWFIQKEIAEIYFEQGNNDQALKFALDSTLSFGDADKKMNLYRLLADILQHQGKTDEARKHIEFICKIRQENKWKIDNDLQQQITLFSIDLSKLSDFRVIQNELRRIWDNLKFDAQDKLKGFIRSILPNGNAGFIEIDKGKSYYFQTKDFKGRKDLINQGQKVTFFLADSFDKKKNQPTKNAINIKPVF